MEKKDGFGKSLMLMDLDTKPIGVLPIKWHEMIFQSITIWVTNLCVLKELNKTHFLFGETKWMF
jgi:hypothetical protein